MITNQKQLRTTRRKIADLEQHRAELLAARSIEGRDPNAIEMEILSVNEVLANFKEQAEDFERLHGSLPSEIHVESLEHLPPAVLKARIAAGLTQAELALRVGLATSAIERYERNSYRTAGLARIVELIDGIGIAMVITHGGVSVGSALTALRDGDSAERMRIENER